MPTINDLSHAVKHAALSRNPSNWKNRPASDGPSYDQDEYASYNDQLHEELTAAALEHFKNTPVDDNYPHGDVDVDFLRKVGTPFTYQNGDWYQPTYECYICVLRPYLSATLLVAFQRLLVAELKDWCIVVVLSEDSSFGEGERIYVFSDQTLLDQDGATLLHMPAQ